MASTKSPLQFSALFSRSLLDDIKAEDPNFNDDWIDIQFVETIKDANSDFDVWRKAVFGFLERLASVVNIAPIYWARDFLEESNTFISMYSDVIGSLWKNLVRDLKTSGELTRRDLIAGLSSYNSVICRMSDLRRFSGYLLLADKHSSLRKVRELSEKPWLVSRGALCDERSDFVGSLYYHFTKVYCLLPSRVTDARDDLISGLTRKLLTNVAARCSYLPNCLWLQDVTLDEQNIIGGDGFADVYKGKWEGQSSH